MKRLKVYLPVLLSALCLSVSRIPLHLGFLVFAAFIPLFWFFQRRSYKAWELLRAASIFSAVFIMIVLYWISEVTPGGLIGIFIIYTLVYWLLFYAIQRISRIFPAWRYVAFTSLFITFEYIQNFGETRFPWWNISYSLADYNVLLQALDLLGTAGLSLLVLVVNILLYKLLTASRQTLVWKRTGLALPVLLVLWFGYGIYTLNTLKLQRHDARVFVMQPSIPQDIKWDEKSYAHIISTYEELTARAAADSAKLLIYPEAAMPVYLLKEPGEIKPLLRMMDKHQVEIFTGFPDYLPAPKGYHYPYYYYNAAALFKPEMQPVDPYYKNILVPVGERMLWLKAFPILWKLEFGQANWEFGTELKWYKSGDYEFSPNICYEIAFPELFHGMAIPRRDGKLHKTDYLVNITNDAWFGTSYGPWLHGVMTRFRAIENRIQIYRSAQTGISMIIDPLGKTLASTKLFEKTNITAPLYITERIPLLRHIYKYPLLICLLALLLFLASIFRHKEK